MLEFNVFSQLLKRTDKFSPATDSVDYLKAKFNFQTEDWTGKAKRAIFRLNTSKYEVVVGEDNTCIIPYEVLVRQDETRLQITGVNKVFVSVYGTKDTVRITTNEVRVDLAASGYGEMETGGEVTPDVYAQYVAQMEAKMASTLEEVKAANKETEQAVAESVEQIEEEMTAVKTTAASFQNNYANALKGAEIGEVVRVDDVSPIEHTAKAKVVSKNMAVPNARNYSSAGYSVAVNEDGSVTVTGSASTTGAIYLSVALRVDSSTQSRVKLKKGEKYIMSAYKDGEITTKVGSKTVYADGTTLWRTAIYFHSGDDTTQDREIAQLYIESTGHEIGDDSLCGTYKVQLERGETVTDYVPYVKPSTVTVSRSGKNLLQPKNNSGAGYTATVNDDGSVTITGSANTTNGIYLTVATPSASNPLSLKKGQPYKFKVWSDNGKTLLMKTLDDDGNAYWTGASDYETVLASGYTNIVQVYAESTKHEVGDDSLCGTYRFQLEAGETSTEYEAFKATETYTPSDDGGAVEFTSIAPTMTVTTDTANTLVELEYNQDINAAFNPINSLLNEIVNGGA